jgi:hypothetical protein
MSFEEDEEIEAKCPLSGISCEECRWRIDYERYEDVEDCFLFSLVYKIRDLYYIISGTNNILKELVKRTIELNEIIYDLKEAQIEKT